MGSAHPDLDDVVQQGLIALIQALPSFRGECPAEYYASRIAVRAAVAARRGATARGARMNSGVDADSIVDEGGGPNEAHAATRRRELIRELLDQLPAEQGETLALRFGLGWTLEEVARATGAPVNTVRSRLRLAKQALRKRIEENPALGEELEVET
jgi:RNA polymerase sigma-70 factor (ECF subfamily)